MHSLRYRSVKYTAVAMYHSAIQSDLLTNAFYSVAMYFINRCLALALFIAASVFTAAGLLLLLQREAGGLDDLSTDSDSSSNTVQYVDTLYFTLMTFATVGYGGDPPTTVLARLVVLALTAGFLIAVPLQVCVH
jgi:Ion channel